jgi:hypothetical protein
MTPEECAAVHEIGHAIAYRALNDRICRIQLHGRGSGLMTGLVRRSRDTPFKAALKCLSGPAAEAFFSDTGTFSRSHCRIDIEDAARHARDAGVPLELIWRKAMELVERNQSDVELLANALLDYGRLGAMT